MRNKLLFGVGLLMVLLLIWVSSLANTISRKNGEIDLLKEKLSTAVSVNEGLKDSVEKLIKYNECIAKIFIAPRSLDKAIVGDVEDPATALGRCRVEVNGVPISENPTPTAPNTNKSTGMQSPAPSTQSIEPPSSTPPPSNPPPPSTPPPSQPPPPEPPPIICIPIIDFCL